MEGLQWLNESQVRTDCSLEWACWVLEFLLRDADELVSRGALHSARVFNTMVQYLRARGSPFKHRVIALLTQLLKSPWLFPTDQRPNIQALQGIEACVFHHCQVPTSPPRRACAPSPASILRTR